MTRLSSEISNIVKIGGVCLLLSLIASFLALMLFYDERFEYITFHSFLEAAGGICALFIVSSIFCAHWELIKFKYTEIAWISAALVSMGFLDIFHAVVPVGNESVWFHSVSILIGGVFCSGIWLNKNQHITFKDSAVFRFSVPAFGFLIVSLIAYVSLTFSHEIPYMFLTSGQFSIIAISLNIVGGLGFIAGYFYFVRSSQIQRRSADLYFAIAFLLFGIAGLTFALSEIWGMVWWWLHVLRFSAYLLLVFYVFKAVHNQEHGRSLVYVTLIARYITMGLLCAVMIMGIVVIFGWYVHNITLIQVLPSFAPMQYNTALCFVLCALGMLLTGFGYRALGMFCGFLASLIALLTLLQYLFECDFGLDQFFVEFTVMTKASHPGRMAPNTSICFILSGLSIVVATLRPRAIFGFSISVFILAVMALLGYLGNEESLYGWGNLTRMAIHTASGFILLSTACIIISFGARQRAEEDLWNSAPLSVAMIFAVITFFGWYIHTEELYARNKAHLKSLINDTQFVLLERYKLYENSLMGGVGFFNAIEDVSQQQWHEYVQALDISRTLPGINGVGYIDYIYAKDLENFLKNVRNSGAVDFTNHPDTFYPDKFIIKYIEPRASNIEAVGLDIGFEANRRAAAERARDLGVPALTKKILLVQDYQKQAGFLLLVPVYNTKTIPSTIEERRKHFRGWVYAPFMGPSFFHDVSHFNLGQLDLTVFDGNTMHENAVIYSNGYRQSELDERIGRRDDGVVTKMKIAGRVWTLLWHQNHLYQPPANPKLAYFLLVLGLSFSVFMYFAMTRFLHSKEIIRQRIIEKTKELKQASDFQDLISNTIPDFIFIKDRNFRIVKANDAFLKLYPDYMRNKILGTTTIENYSEAEAEEFLKHDRLTFETGYFETEEILMMPDGTRRTLYTKKVRFTDHAGDQFILGIARDISRMKDVQKEMERTNQELERSNKELVRFAYIASHDLQEPLRKIAGFTDRLEVHLAESIKNDDKAQLYMNFITDGVTRMRELIMGLLEYCTVTTTDVKRSLLDVNEIVEIAKDNLSTLISENNAQVITHNLPEVYHDKIMLIQIFQNLISNAIKYRSDNDPIIEITVKKGKRYWEFKLQDNGMGIEEKYLTRIFEMFQRLHRKEEVSGTGIGLSLCQKIIERYGGQIWVTSKFGEGSCFYFTVPIQKVH